MGGGVAEQLWRAVAVFRIAALLSAAALVIANHEHYARPGLGWLLLAVMAAWTVVMVAAGRRPDGPPRLLLVADVAVAAGLVLATLAVETSSRVDQGSSTLPAAWVAGAVLACAVAGGWWAGGAAAVVISVADLVERGAVTAHTFNGVVLLLLAGFVGGYVVDLSLRAQRAVAAASRREAAVAERERLARKIHDSVLQVLALVAHRGADPGAELRALGRRVRARVPPRGPSSGGELGELARLAGEQEVAWRALVAAPPAEPDEQG